ncbi:MAG: terpene cyclase/mutase family protein [Planctomycetes bacterium]|nr:terpene cyclase/mutase family protein [Planctomycetota bacterium]
MKRDIFFEDEVADGDDQAIVAAGDQPGAGPSLVEHCPECGSRHTEFAKFHPLGAAVGALLCGAAGYAVGGVFDNAPTAAVLGAAFGGPGAGVGLALASPRMVCTRCAHKWRTGWQHARELLVFLPSFGAALGIVLIVSLVLLAIKLAGKLQTPDDVMLQTSIEEVPPDDPYDPDLKRPLDPIQQPTETVPDPSEDPRIDPTAVDPVNEDPIVDPVKESMRDNDSDALNVSPFNRLNSNSSLGVGSTGPVGGGGDPFGRGPGSGKRRATGKGPKTDDAVLAALMWLKRHQSPDGGWRAKGFHALCGKDAESDDKGAKFPGACANLGGTDDTGWETVDVGVTGLALLAYLGNGHTHRDGKFRKTVRDALTYLKASQNADGSFGPQDQHQGNYNHSICTMAIAEAYGMTGFAPYREVAQRAVNYIVSAQNESLGWRYGVKPGDNDSSVTGWMVLALKSARVTGLEFPDKTFEGALAWYAIATDPAYGKVGYTARGGQQARLPNAQGFAQNEAMTAVALVSKLFMGVPRTDPALKLGADALVSDLPAWGPEPKIDYYYWYYATLSLFQMDQPWWDKWCAPAFNVLIDNQRQGAGQAKDPKEQKARNCADGSWDAIDAWGSAGGRVYATAINALTLETIYRYRRIGEH